MPAPDQPATPESSVDHWRAMHRAGYFPNHKCYQDRMHEDGVAHLIRLLEPTESDTLLEIGCGYGRVLYRLAPLVGRAIGVDIAPEPLDDARTLLADHENVQLAQTTGLGLPEIDDGSVDAAFAFTVFQHLPRPLVQRYLQDAMRVLRPGGRFCAQFLTGGNDTEADIGDRPEEQSLFYDASQIALAAERAGLRIQRIERQFLPQYERFDWYWLLATRPET
jgi:SAM-dependent methyltransferase